MRAFAVPLQVPLLSSVPADDQLKCCGKCAIAPEGKPA